MQNSTVIPSHIARMAKTIIRLNRLEELKSYGFTEQNNVVRYKQKLKKNQLAQTRANAKNLDNNARTFRLFVDRCVGLA